MHSEPLTDSTSSHAILEALPHPAFVVDEDLVLLDANESARRFVAVGGGVALKRLCGDVLHCLHAMTSEGGCGSTPACGDCVVRGVVAAVFGGEQVERRRSILRLEGPEGEREIHVIVTASRLDLPGRGTALLVIEDITEWIELEGIVPICAECKKIRSDSEYWEQVESYISKRTRLQFSHGLCPTCAADLMAKYDLDD